MPPADFIRSVRLLPSAPRDRYPFDLPAVRALRRPGGLVFDGAVTFLIGENGSGKSTLLEGIAVAAGFNAEGGADPSGSPPGRPSPSSARTSC